MEELPIDIIKLGPLTVRFFCDGEKTNGAVDFFEFSIPGRTKGTAPHYHENVDEIVYGLEGEVIFVVDTVDRVVRPREFCFIPRGVIHYFHNASDREAVALSILTPALIGPSYLREIGAAMGHGAPQDPAVLHTIMTRHGLVPAVTPMRGG